MAKKSIESATIMAVVGTILTQARSDASTTEDRFIIDAVNGLSRLEEVTERHLSQVIGLVDGKTELCERYQNLVLKEREAVANGPNSEYENADEVPPGDARMVPSKAAVTALKVLRARLDSLRRLTVAPASPASPRDMISVPDGGRREGRDLGQAGDQRA